MDTKYSMGDSIYFRGTINKIEIYPYKRIAYRVREWPEFLFLEDSLSETVLDANNAERKKLQEKINSLSLQKMSIEKDFEDALVKAKNAKTEANKAIRLQKAFLILQIVMLTAQLVVIIFQMLK